MKKLLVSRILLLLALLAVMITPACDEFLNEVDPEQLSTSIHDPVPADNQDSVGLSPVLGWQIDNPLHLDLTFTLYFSESSLPLTPLAEDLKYTFYSFKQDLEPGTEYRWRIEGADSLGNIHTHAPWTFTTLAEEDTSGGEPPDTTIVEPPDTSDTDSLYFIGHYDPQLNVGYDLFMAAGLVLTDDGSFVIGYQRTGSYSPHETRILAVDSEGNVNTNRSALPDVGYFRRFSKRAEDGSALFCGYKLAGSSQDYYHQMEAVWIDGNGNILRQVTATEGYRVLCSDVLELDGGYLFAGAGYLGEIDSGNSFDAILTRTDLSGNVLWQQVFDQDWDRGTRVLQAPDGGFYFIGATADYKGDLVSSLLKKISADGNVEWEYEYGAQERIEVLNALPLDDGGFVTTSLLPDPEGSGIISAFSTFSDSGQLINETTYRYANDNYIERALNMERMQNGDYLILVSITTYTDNYFIFREVTPGGELVKETRYLQGYRHYAPNMVMHEDGSVTVLLVLEGADGSDDITLSLLHLVP